MAHTVYHEIRSPPKVPPAELEAVLLTHPAVREAGVTAIPDQEAGELPRGYVSLKEGHQATEDEILQYVAGIYLNRNYLNIS